MNWSSGNFGYEVGGSLPADSPTYVFRAVDHNLFDAIRSRKLCYVLNARQMGKSSLRVQTMERLRKVGVACEDVDLSIVSTKGISAEEWYAGVADWLSSRLGVAKGRSFSDWWERHAPLAPVMRLAKLFEDVLATRAEEEVVIFFDEIDALLGLDFGDDFFALLRAWHERGANQPAARRLTFVLIGVATPTELIKNPRRSPFNIGQAIHLEGFQLDEARGALLPGLATKFGNPENVLRQILAWTGGQPFLTQKLCSLAMGDPSTPKPGDEKSWVAELVHSRVVIDWEAQDEPVHLRTIRDRLVEQGSRTGRLLGLYKKILEAGVTVGHDSSEQMELRLSGLAVERGGKLQVANSIYTAIFDLAWVRTRLAELRPYAHSLDSWRSSDRTDLSLLLTGDALQSARAWATGKSLSDEDYQFLEASGEFERRRFEVDLQQTNDLLRKAKRRAQGLGVIGMSLLVLTMTASLMIYISTSRAAEQASRVAGQAQRAAELAKKRLAVTKRDTESVLAVLTKRTFESSMAAELAKDRLEDAKRDTESALALLTRRALESRRLEELNIGLEQERIKLENSIRQTSVKGLAATYLAGIAQDPKNLRPAEMEVFRQLGESPEEVRFEFLRQALESTSSARRIEHRLELAGQALIGLSPSFRDRVFQDLLLPCLRQSSQLLDIQRTCAELAGGIGGLDSDSATLILSVVREFVKLSNDLEDIDRLTALLPGLARALPSNQTLKVFNVNIAAAETAIPNLSGELADRMGSRLEEIASLLDGADRIEAARYVLAAVTRITEAPENRPLSLGWRRHFWVRILASIPGDFPPAIRQASFDLISSNATQEIVSLARKVRPNDASAALSQLIALAPQLRASTALEQALVMIVGNMNQEEAGSALRIAARDLLSADQQNEFMLLSILKATSARSLPVDQMQALGLLLDYRSEMVKILTGMGTRRQPSEMVEDLQTAQRVVRWARAIEALPVKLPLSEEKWPLPELIALLDRTPNSGVFIPNFTEETVLEIVLIAVASKTNPDRTAYKLSGALEDEERRSVVRPLVRALASTHVKMNSADAHRIFKKILETLWENADNTELSDAVGILARQVSPSASQEVALEVLASIERPKEYPWSGPVQEEVRLPRLPRSTHYSPIHQRFERSREQQRERPWQVDERKFLLAAGILVALPQNAATKNAARELWPLITGALMCEMIDLEMDGVTWHQSTRTTLVSADGRVLKVIPTSHDCDVLAEAVKLLPGTLEPEHIRELADAVGSRFECNSTSRAMFTSLVKRVESTGVDETDEYLLQEIDKKPGPHTMSCLLPGLGIQTTRLTVKQFERVLRGFIASYKYARPDTPPRMSTRKPGDGTKRPLEAAWEEVAKRVSSVDAHHALDLLLLQVAESADPDERSALTKILPTIAGNVSPGEAQRTFQSLVRATISSFDSNTKQKLGESIAALPAEVPLSDLIAFLSQPHCIGSLRKAVLSHLERQAGETFGDDLWASLAWARKVATNVE